MVQLEDRPDEDELKETAAETWSALQKVVDTKAMAMQPKNLPAQPGAATYIKYTPQQQGPQVLNTRSVLSGPTHVPR